MWTLKLASFFISIHINYCMASMTVVQTYVAQIVILLPASDAWITGFIDSLFSVCLGRSLFVAV